MLIFATFSTHTYTHAFIDSLNVLINTAMILYTNYRTRTHQYSSVIGIFLHVRTTLLFVYYLHFIIYYKTRV